MKLQNLSTEIINKIRTSPWDGIVGKHEGPFNWSTVLEDEEPPEFIEIEGRAILLPIPFFHHQNITILRIIWSKDEKSLTLFLKDTTYFDNKFQSGFVAVCDWIEGDIFLAILFHEWFILESK
ncbi:hypothetical protein [Kamptonema sp. UHCC 0994]|uniref:hypothetical protein n=1 Tax=Kamptonema sp. UHCC 0994 TaxID=3031329 RepID=UPI0023B93B67|nr:hypothetical protein [Kamptonema sp. UHCC 0994]MDF0553139.1 hypothetical protein [Kamptonema sp. UHCC 0994]